MSENAADQENRINQGLPDSVGLDIARDELKYVRDQLAHSDTSTATIIQFITIIFASGVLAATREPLAIMAVPIFWGVWLLHAQMRDRDTIKYSEYARWLEDRINLAIGLDLLNWERQLTARTHKRPFVFQFSYVYWGLINIASWVMASVVLWRANLAGWAVVIASVGAAVWLATGIGLAFRSKFQVGIRAKLTATRVVLTNVPGPDAGAAGVLGDADAGE